MILSTAARRLLLTANKQQRYGPGIVTRAITASSTSSFGAFPSSNPAPFARHNRNQQQLLQNQQQQQQIRSLHLTPREIDHLQLHQCGRLAQYRLARGLKLNVPESIALITSVMMEKIRDGDTSVVDLMSMGQSLLGRRQVQPGVASMVTNVQIEATFPDGTKLLTVHYPISKTDGDLTLALEGSFLPFPI